MANTNIKNCDLLVLGAGGSGLIAAVKAKDLGVKDVLVLEKAEKTGGCTWFSGAAPMPDNSTPEERDDLFRKLMKHLYWNVNPKLIRNAIEVSAPLWNWFSSVCDVTDMYPKTTASTQGAKPKVKTGGADETDPRGIMTSLVASGFGGGGEAARQINKKSKDPSIGPGSAGSWGVLKLVGACEKMGIPILTSTRATEFITDAKGSVTGILADTKEGKLQVNCKACIVATGGFGANMEKLTKRWPTLLGGNNKFHKFSCPTDTGDAIDMAEKIGIKIDWEDMNILLGGVAHHPYSGSIVEFVRNPEIVFVNLNGERFCDEDLGMGSTYIMTKQPKSQMYFVADHDMVDLFGKRNVTGRQPARDAMLKDYWEDVAYEVSLDEGGAPGNHTKSSDTLEGLAKKMGVDPKTFVKTIETYNQYCDNKRDMDFAKKPEYLIPVRKPPFYAFFGQRFLETTHGGLVVNENMEVLKDRDKKDIVPGLYCAGDASGGWTVDKPLPPISAGAWMPNSGYMAGISAAKYLGKA
jgi:fumarate reductase flavoprotein subunit